MKALTELQKAVARDLLKQCFEHGFASLYPLAPIAAKHGVAVKDLYDEEKQSGALFPLGPYGEGLIEISRDGDSAGVCMVTHEMLAHWADYRPLC